MNKVEALEDIKRRHINLNGIVLTGDIDWLISEIERLTEANKAQGKLIKRLQKEKKWLIDEVKYGSLQKKEEVCERMYQALKEK